jgi:hypothetical protein
MRFWKPLRKNNLNYLTSLLGDSSFRFVYRVFIYRAILMGRGCRTDYIASKRGRDVEFDYYLGAPAFGLMQALQHGQVFRSVGA